MCWTASVAVRPDAFGPGTGRRFSAESVSDRYAGSVDLLESVAIVTSELVTNSVQAGAAAIELALDGHRDWILLRVSDDAPGTPQIGLAGNDAVSGRGLSIVQALAAQWGVDVGESGKSVWAVLGVEDPGLSSFECSGPVFAR